MGKMKVFDPSRTRTYEMDQIGFFLSAFGDEIEMAPICEISMTREFYLVGKILIGAFHTYQFN
jgi:hypothetical protein